LAINDFVAIIRHSTFIWVTGDNEFVVVCIFADNIFFGHKIGVGIDFKDTVDTLWVIENFGRKWFVLGGTDDFIEPIFEHGTTAFGIPKNNELILVINKSI